MLKKGIVLSMLFVLGFIAFALKTPSPSQILNVQQTPSLLLKGDPAEPRDLAPAQSSPREQLKHEIATIKAELDKIDFATEINNPSTPLERRKWIVAQMNQYTKKIGQLAKIQLQEMNKELKP